VTASFPPLLLRLADTKHQLGRRFSEWTNRAPALEAAVAAAALTQDELGHARGLYAALQGTPEAPEAYLGEGRPAPLRREPMLAEPFRHWAEFVAAVALFDRAMTLVFEAARSSSYGPLRQRAAKILQEEWFHWNYGQGWLKRLAAESRTRAAMQAAVNRFWRPTADWLATVDDGSAAQGVLTDSAEVIGQRWADEGRALLSKCGLAMP